MSNDIYTMYEENSQLISLLDKTRNASSQELDTLRKKLYKGLKKRYKRLNNMGIDQIQFVLPNNQSFLRMNMPESFGDNLSKVRPDISYTNKTKAPSEGFFVGRSLDAFRFVYPLFNKQKQFLASVEISYSSKKLLEHIRPKYIITKHFLISKSIVDSTSWLNTFHNNYHISPENSDYYIVNQDFSEIKDTKVDEFIKALNKSELLRKMTYTSAFSMEALYNYRTIVMTAIPVKNSLTNTNNSFLIFYTESDFLDTLKLEKNYVLLLILSIISMLFLFSVYISITQRKLREMAHFDKLTRLPNRAYFYIELEQEIKRSKRYKNTLALMFLDLDGFKAVNDTYGHNVGDELLIQVARRLEKSVRGTDIIGRVGGDEFVILLTDIKKWNKYSNIADTIIQDIGKEFTINNQTIQIGVSIGIATYPEDATDLSQLINFADTAMYEAKKNGKNNFILYKNLTQEN
jgi:diguanylate cyclase (GGDEF)-like protein